MTVLMLIGLTWTLLALPVAMVVGRALRFAGQAVAPASWTDEVEQFLREQPSTRTAG